MVGSHDDDDDGGGKEGAREVSWGLFTLEGDAQNGNSFKPFDDVAAYISDQIGSSHMRLS